MRDALRKLQHVFAFDVAALSERLGVSQQELVDGITRDHDHVALRRVLERVGDEAGDEADDDDDEQGGNRHICCRQACLLLLPAKARDARGSRSRHRFAPLLMLEDGRSVLEHILHELFQPRVVDRLVVCVPSALADSDSSARAAVAKTAARLGAIAKVAVQVLDVDEGEGHTGAIRRAASCFAGAPASPRKRRSDGFLVLGCDRIFDAPTIRMMAVATRSAPAESGDRVLVRALVDLDVDFVADPDNNDSNNDEGEQDDSEQYAGIFAFIGDVTATADVFKHEVSEPEQQQLKRGGSLAELLKAACAESTAAVSVEKVVASDYCSWRKAEHDHGQQPRSVERQALSAFHSSAKKHKQLEPYESPPRSEQSLPSESDFDYFEFRREPSLLTAHGYHGFKVDTTLVEVRDPELVPEQRIERRMSEDKPLLGAVSGANNNHNNNDSSSGYEHSGYAYCEKLELGTEATVLTDTDLDSMLNMKNRAFLIQIGPDSAESPTASCSREGSLHHPMRLDRDEGVFLALPDALQTIKEDDPMATNELDVVPRRRRFSQLPSAVQEIKMEAIVQQPRTRARASSVSVNVVVKTKVPMVGYAILLIALCAVSSQGAVQDLLVGVPPLLKVFWRMTGASLAFAPLAIYSLAQDNWHLPQLSLRKKALFALCGVSYSVYNATFIVALSLTSVGHTYIFSNCHSLLLVLAKLVLRQPFGPLELIGAGIGFSGGVITTMDHSSDSADPTSQQHPLRHGPSTLGDMIAFAGAFAGVAYLMSAKRVRPHMSVFVFMWTQVTTVAVLVLLVLLWDNSTAPSIQILSTDDTHGLFGWVHHLNIEAYVVLVGSFAGTMGFVTALRYFDPLVVSVTMLTEPVVATIIGICVGVDQLPGPLTFFGGIAVLAGCSLVLLATHKTCTRVDVSDALVEPTGIEKQLHPRDSSRRRHSVVHPRQLQHKSSFRVNYGSFP